MTTLRFMAARGRAPAAAGQAKRAECVIVVMSWRSTWSATARLREVHYEALRSVNSLRHIRSEATAAARLPLCPTHCNLCSRTLVPFALCKGTHGQRPRLQGSRVVMAIEFRTPPWQLLLTTQGTLVRTRTARSTVRPWIPCRTVSV